MGGYLTFFAMLWMAAPVAGGAEESPTGYWNTSRGVTTLERTNFGSFVLGRYADENGRLSSSILEGTVLAGEWIQPTGEHPCREAKGNPPSRFWGRYRIEFVDEHKAFVGSWGHCDGPLDNDWVGSKFAVLDELPTDGVIPHGGMLPPSLRNTRDDNCSCESVSLARLYTQTSSETQFHYVIDRSDRIGITVPELNRGDRLCLQFTFPRSSAYLVGEGQPHPCKARVGLKFPYSRSSTGEIEEVWELFSIRGMAALRSAATNTICRGMALEDERVPAGRARMALVVNGLDCEPLEFTVGDEGELTPGLCPDRMPSARSRLTCRCEPPFEAGLLFGTYYYTWDSPICGAAAHVGAVGPEGGWVTARTEHGRVYYTGSLSNGLQSGAWGGYSGTMVFEGVDHPERRLGLIPKCPAYWESAESGLCRCPAESRGGVWGSGPYTSDSNVCAAARHAGIVPAEGGLVRARFGPGLETYPASTANDITTAHWGAYRNSLIVMPY
ncbi:LCCL domain-containing protein [Salinarimonas rosea]|uniref:LCCL domain-containing protein n=1 Tax=Salinarimonas rosea TaxID=552063 RepID=UPI00146FC02C|nr:LCCL domain-containing protein [Salinarimonas rosea]